MKDKKLWLCKKEVQVKEIEEIVFIDGELYKEYEKEIPWLDKYIILINELGYLHFMSKEFFLRHFTEAEEEPTKEWEILEFRRNNMDAIFPIWILLEDGKYNTPESKEGLYELNEMLYGDYSVETGDFIIHKIKRLSDNEVFTIGDMITGATYSTPREIQEFILVHGELEIKQKGGYTKIEYVQKAKSVLFTTEDGVDVYEGDKVYTVLKDASRSFIDRIDACGRKSSKLVYFSTREAAEKWIDDNKPIYSKKQIGEALMDSCSDFGYSRRKKINLNTFEKKLNL